MNRRKLLSGSGSAASVIIAGCLDRSSNGDIEGDEEYESVYELYIEAPEESPDEMDSCKFDDLPEGARTEFETAIEEADFETEDSVVYRLEASPVMLETDCYGQYIEYEDEYYMVDVSISSG